MLNVIKWHLCFIVIVRSEKAEYGRVSKVRPIQMSIVTGQMEQIQKYKQLDDMSNYELVL